MTMTEEIMQLEADNKKLRDLAREVGGIWSCYETELRSVMGNTNYAVVVAKLAAVTSADRG